MGSRMQHLGPSGEALRQSLAEKSGTRAEDWFFSFRGREAMEVVFTELRLLRGEGRVLTQLFTCSTVPEAILAGGLLPHYADIREDSLDLDPSMLPREESNRALIFQHTYGIFHKESEQALCRLAREQGLLLMEDSAHCLGHIARDDAGKPLADVSLHSFGVEKMIPTSFGAALWIDPEMEDQELRERLVERFSSLPPCGPVLCRAVENYRKDLRILSHLPMGIRRPLRRRWTASGRFLPALSEEELAGGTLLSPSLPEESVLARCLEKIRDLEENEARRLEAVKHYLAALEAETEAYRIPRAAMEQPRPLLWFPLILKEEAKAAQLTGQLTRSGYYSSGWGRPLLSPGVSDPAAFGMPEDMEDYPRSRAASQGILLLPTLRSVEEADSILKIVREGLGL